MDSTGSKVDSLVKIWTLFGQSLHFLGDPSPPRCWEIRGFWNFSQQSYQTSEARGPGSGPVARGPWPQGSGPGLGSRALGPRARGRGPGLPPPREVPEGVAMGMPMRDGSGGSGGCSGGGKSV